VLLLFGFWFNHTKQNVNFSKFTLICSLKSDRVNLVEPASLAYRARPTLLIPDNVVGVPGGAVQRTFSSGSSVHELNVILKLTCTFL